jgi:hypothetical protein
MIIPRGSVKIKLATQCKILSFCMKNCLADQHLISLDLIIKSLKDVSGGEINGDCVYTFP